MQSLDWRDDLAANRQQFGKQFAFQGNLDPSLLHGSTEMAKSATRQGYRLLETCLVIYSTLDMDLLLRQESNVLKRC
ncbi:MAG: hypothetical protein CM15mP2_4070 [Methanobacteriota archaeon]|nr:MAG: hypothetical protein CM15mP2_4070 [Euryarchaeota archaeon]